MCIRDRSRTHDVSQGLHEDLHRSRQKDMEVQERLEHAEEEVKRLNTSLVEAEKRAQVTNDPENFSDMTGIKTV